MFDIKKYRRKSPWILHYNAGSCNGCDIEILACMSPKYDLERFGVINTGNPKQSDIFLVTGPVTYRSRERLVELYTQMPEPKIVVAVGSCSCTGGVFRDMYNVEDGVDRYIPVDIYIPGCATSPELIIDGVVKGLEILQIKTKEMEKPFKLFKDNNLKDGIISRRDSALKVGEADEKN
ncbi:NADH-quinone oxidoreductase subunit B family protein [Candidatus Sulfurimonas marisnigri]|uniref:NADH-quinone oxidoreductase subunit B family protein n=1 Tax=Candidatus Sulfurimonas marisnigri TaxID=2740405 RepID=A0A7S7LYL7_9BACT|nr:NADH-quinone oxidoreductase subunit B family protein [Candidatus Sulfurimonas marisnigri]QOY53836.1 NADH-quinone oxidoreductase subunit B family protein [Candidatus Sulfurimonas marisnigri]